MRTKVFRLGLAVLRKCPFPARAARGCIRFFIALGMQPDVGKSLVTLFEIHKDTGIILNMLAIEYGHGVHVKHRLMDYHRFFTDRIEPAEKVIDIGCGDGDLAYSIATDSKAEVTAVDMDAKRIVSCEKRFRHARLTFICMDATLAKPKEQFDVVVLSNVLEHIRDRVHFLADIESAFTPAKILIRVPMLDRHWHVPLKKELGLPYFSDDTHYTEYTLESFEKEITAAGLSIKHCQVNWGEIWAVVRNMP